MSTTLTRRLTRTIDREASIALLVLAATIIGAGLRFANLNGIPPALNQDEAVNGYDAYSLLRTGRDHHGHPFPLAGLEAFGDWVSPLITFLTVPAVAIFGLRVETLRLVSAAVGTLAIPASYLLGSELFGRRTIGLLAAWLVAVSPWHTHLSRWAIPPALVPTMVALTMFTLVWSAHKSSNRGIVAAAGMAGLTVASYPTMKLYLPLLGLAAALVYGSSYLRLKREAPAYAAAIFVAIAGPILYLSTVDPGGRARLEQVSVFSAEETGPWFLVRQYLSYFSPRFLFAAGDENPMHSPPGYGLELWSTLPLLLAGLFWLVRVALYPSAPRQRRSALFLLFALALYPVPGALTLPSPHTLRAAHLMPLNALVTATGAIAILDAVRRLLRSARPVVVRSTLALLLVLAVGMIGAELAVRYGDYFIAYPNKVLPQYQYGLEQAIDYTQAHESEYSEIWMSDINQAYIYVLFYTGWPPSDVHQSLQIRRDPPAFNEVTALGRYRFGAPPDLSPDELAVVHTIHHPDGGIAYEVRGGETKDGKRILWVRGP